MSLDWSSSVDHPIDDVFHWHERPGAFQRLAPPWQAAHIIEEASSLAHGRAVIGLPGGLRWVAQHSDFDPPRRFVDDLVSLPLHWHHVHSFAPEGPSRTRITDTVTTPVPASLLRSMFTYRHIQLRDDLDVSSDLHRLAPATLTVAVTGSSGVVGTALCAFLSTGGHRVVRLVRRAPQHADERTWTPDDPDPRVFEEVDAVVHLAGASIAGRFSETHKQAIATSRIEPTRRIADAILRAERPHTLVVASAIGYYGSDRGEELLSERSGSGDGFLAHVVDEWEAATRRATDAGLRVVTVRTGIVLSPRGGLLRVIRPMFLAGLGGRVGDGSQWLSWIDLDDLTDIYSRALVDVTFAGPVNAVAPGPVRNDEFTSTLARVLHRPALVSVPRAALGLLVGAEGVREIACASQRVVPERLQSAGFRFRRPALESSLRHQLGRFAPDGVGAPACVLKEARPNRGDFRERP
ncbi:MAG: TIGR01777 family oxidoreductase [Acidimicrobiales bacterium]